MKFSVLFAGAASAALVTRDLATVQTALSDVTKAAQALQSGIQGFQGAGQAVSLQNSAENVISVTNMANQQVAGSSVLTATDALKLPTPVQALGTVVSDTVNVLIQKKPTFVSAGVCSIVQMETGQIRDSAATFSKTLLSKVPANLQTIGQGLAQPITDALNRAVAAYQSCPSGGGSGSSMSGSSMPASSMPATTSSGSAPVSSSPATSTGSAPSYPSGSAPASSSSVVVVPTSSAPAVGGSTGSGAPAPAYTGAASNNAAGFGAAALAAVAVLAL